MNITINITVSVNVQQKEKQKLLSEVNPSMHNALTLLKTPPFYRLKLYFGGIKNRISEYAGQAGFSNYSYKEGFVTILFYIKYIKEVLDLFVN